MRMTEAAECVTRIEGIGADADGVGRTADGSAVFVPFTLPGEQVRVRELRRRGEGWSGIVDAILVRSADRAEPACPHFGLCGGCAVQHWRDAAYAAWKAGLLTGALRRAGCVDPQVAKLVRTAPGSRRRIDLALCRTHAGLQVGLHRAHATDVVDLVVCPVLRAELSVLIAPLRMLARSLSGLRRQGSAILNLLESGPDLLLRTDAPLTTQDRTSLVGFARANDLPRISWARGIGPAEAVCKLRPATTVLSGVRVAPPPGAFLQASSEGEAAIVAAVLAGLPHAMTAKARIAELYAGCGTLTFALAARAGVTAFEADADAVAALSAASAGLRITATRRDLTRQPLDAKELARFTVVVLDPPWAGAAAQMPAIAARGVPVVIYVSCNPAALARDARMLLTAGYRVTAATPIDQFLWSGRLESVIVFAR